MPSLQGQDRGGEWPDDAACFTTGRFVGMFSYGSNNERQLSARVKTRLRGCPAYLEDYVRVFGASAPLWKGSVASIARKEGGRVHGCFYLMTPQEVETLDVYERVKEGGYYKEAVMVNVRVSRNGDGVEEGAKPTAEGGISVDGHYVSAPAMTYIMSRRHVEKFVPPDPAYLTSVYNNLNGSFPELSGRPIEVCDHTGKKRSEWTYPGCRNLPLRAFLVEVGLRENPPWTFPLVLEPLLARLAATEITTTEALCVAATGGVLLSRMESQSSQAIHRKAGEGGGSVTGGGDARGSAELESDALIADESAATLGEKRNPVYEAKAVRRWVATVIVPDFTEQTVGIISQIASGGDDRGDP